MKRIERSPAVIHFLLRRRQAIFFAAGLVASQSLASIALAQQPTTVQLPTFRFFSVSTTVSVPDRGSTYLGGIGSSGSRSTSRGIGPLANRAGAHDTGASGMSISATIHDFEAMDKALLAEASLHRAPWREGVDVAAEMRSIEARRAATSEALPGSVASIKAEKAAEEAEKTAELRELLTKAQAYENQGKPAVAKAFYQMVARRGSGELARFAAERLQALQSTR